MQLFVLSPNHHGYHGHIMEKLLQNHPKLPKESHNFGDTAIFGTFHDEMGGFWVGFPDF